MNNEKRWFNSMLMYNKYKTNGVHNQCAMKKNIQSGFKLSRMCVQIFQIWILLTNAVIFSDWRFYTQILFILNTFQENFEAKPCVAVFWCDFHRGFFPLYLVFLVKRYLMRLSSLILLQLIACHRNNEVKLENNK